MHTGKAVCPQVHTEIPDTLLEGGRMESPAKAAFSTQLCQETELLSSSHKSEYLNVMGK